MRVLQKVLFLLLIATQTINVNAQSFLMGNQPVINTCSGFFYDSGGNSTYSNAESSVTTFSGSGAPVYFAFIDFRLEAIYDSLFIYDGIDTNANLIGGYSGTTSPRFVYSTNPSNSLTFRFKSDSSVCYDGWRAVIACDSSILTTLPDIDAGLNPFCSSTFYNFRATINLVAAPGPDYACLTTQPNPSWYYLIIDTPGHLDITLGNSNMLDVDFVCWGPYLNAVTELDSFNAQHVVDCSYSTAAEEHINIPNAQTGEYYVFCITNFSNQVTDFYLITDDTSTATTNCDILPIISAMRVSLPLCDSNTNTYQVSGSVITLVHPADNDTLFITSSLGDSISILGPFPDTINYTFSHPIANKGIVKIIAHFAFCAACSFTTSYLEPESCTCGVSIANVNPVCEGDSINFAVSVNGTVNNYIWTGPNGFSSTLNTPPIYNAALADSGLYKLTISSDFCKAEASAIIQVLNAPDFSVPTINNVSCSDSGSILVTVNSTGSVDFMWSNGSTGNYITDLTAANYSVTATDQNGCSGSASYVIQAAQNCDTLATTLNGHLNEDKIISFYPNPAGEQINIRWLTPAASTTLQFSNVLGQTLYTYPSLQYDATINISNWQNGVYFWSLIQNDKPLAKGKLLINH